MKFTDEVFTGWASLSNITFPDGLIIERSINGIGSSGSKLILGAFAVKSILPDFPFRLIAVVEISRG